MKKRRVDYLLYAYATLVSFGIIYAAGINSCEFAVSLPSASTRGIFSHYADYDTTTDYYYLVSPTELVQFNH